MGRISPILDAEKARFQPLGLLAEDDAGEMRPEWAVRLEPVTPAGPSGVRRVRG